MVRKSTPSSQKPEIPDINGVEVLRRVLSGDIPSNWRIFYASRAKVRGKCLVDGFRGLALGFGLWLVVLILIGWLAGASLSQSMEGLKWAMLILLMIISSISAAYRAWTVNHNRIMVLRPAGIVDGKINVIKVIRVINYKDVIRILVMVGSVNIDLRKRMRGKRKLWLDLSLFESSEVLPLRIYDAYEEFRANARV